MSSSSPIDFDSLWDYNQPDRTEMRFREILLQIPENVPAFLELLTQIARAQGLQRKFDHAHQTLNQVERRLGNIPSRPRVRYLLERGRVFNTAGDSDRARPLFEQAFEMASQLSEDFYAVDALHMLAIIAPPDQSLKLNLRAIQCAEDSRNEQARHWLGSLYNNTGWSLHNLGEHAQALEMFEKAEAWRRSKANAADIRVAVWCVARAQRSLNRLEEALSRQMDLKKEFDLVGETDGYVLEEIGECLLAMEQPEQAKKYFAEAYDILSRDAFLSEHEPERLARLKTLGS
ncbi:MAG TPA: tetratricopeptide repeat protein [Anaerolineales bacterium]|nr:tetratricopeptide repeat protein [Anaerolineales bacterium]